MQVNDEYYISDKIEKFIAKKLIEFAKEQRYVSGRKAINKMEMLMAAEGGVKYEAKKIR